MGYTAEASGTISFPPSVTSNQISELAVASGAPPYPAGHQVGWGDALTDALGGLDDVVVSELPDGTAQAEIFLSGKVGQWLDDALSSLAEIGGRGTLNFIGEDGEQWLVCLTEKGAASHYANKFYPTLPGGNSEITTLTRDEVADCIAFLTGKKSDGQEKLLQRLVALL